MFLKKKENGLLALHLPMKAVNAVGRIPSHSNVNTTYRYLSANDETLYQAVSILESIRKAD